MAGDSLTPDVVAQVYTDLRGALHAYLRRQVGDAAVAECCRRPNIDQQTSLMPTEY